MEHRFTSGERNVWQNIKMSQNINQLILALRICCHSTGLSHWLQCFFSFFQIRRTVVTRVHEAVKALALCHNVTPVFNESKDFPAGTVTENGHIELQENYEAGEEIVYQASSPDEVYGYQFISMMR